MKAGQYCSSPCRQSAYRLRRQGFRRTFEWLDVSKYRAASILLPLLLLVGCDSVPIIDPAPSVGPIGTQVHDASQGIRAAANETVTVAEDGSRVAPDLSHWSTIIRQQGTILGLTVQLDGAAAQLEDVQGELDRERASHGERVAALERELAEARSAAAERERWIWTLFKVFGAAGMVGAVVLGYFNPRLAPFVFVAGVACASVGVFMADWSWTLGIAMGGMVLFGGGMMGWAIWRRFGADKAEAERAADLLRDAHENRTPLEAVIASFRTDWAAFDAAWRAGK